MRSTPIGSWGNEPRRDDARGDETRREPRGDEPAVGERSSATTAWDPAPIDAPLDLEPMIDAPARPAAARTPELPMLDEPTVVPAAPSSSTERSASSGTAPTQPVPATPAATGAPPRLHDEAELGDLPYRSLERLTNSPRTDSHPVPAPPVPARKAMPTVVMGGPCRYCGQALPEGRAVTFCPSCGQNVTLRHCPACSTELEIGWKFCITCGRQVDEEPAPRAAS